MMDSFRQVGRCSAATLAGIGPEGIRRKLQVRHAIEALQRDPAQGTIGTGEPLDPAERRPQQRPLTPDP